MLAPEIKTEVFLIAQHASSWHSGLVTSDSPVRRTPVDALLNVAGGWRGLIYSAVPVFVFVAMSSAVGLFQAVAASVGVAAAILVWQLVRRQPVRSSLFGFGGIAASAGLAAVTGESRDFFLPGIWGALLFSSVLVISLLIGRPAAGYMWAWATGNDNTWRRIPKARTAFTLVTLAMAVISGSRFIVQGHFYVTGQTEWLALARVAMGWPLFAVTATLVFLAIRTTQRALAEAP